LVRLGRLGEHRQEIEADLLELFAIRTTDSGHWFASRRYVMDALSLLTYRFSPNVPAPRRHSGGFAAMKQDVVFAARLFRRQPGLFGLTVVGLAVAIGISTAAFSIVKAVVFGGYGIFAPDSVFRVATTTGPFTRTTGNSAQQGNWAFSDYRRLQETASSLSVVASVNDFAEFRRDRDDGDPVPVTFKAVTGSYAPVLGLRASLGRTLTPADDAPGVNNVVVSHGFWKNRLGSDRSVIGRTVWLSDRPVTVIGVADRAHSAPPNRGDYPPALWTTLATHAEMWTGGSRAGLQETRTRLQALQSTSGLDASARERLKALEADLNAPPRQWNPAVDVFGRSKPGITRAQAEAEVLSIAGTLASEHGRNESARRSGVQLQSLEKRDGQSILLVGILITIVGLVIFLACANVTNLLLASAAGRRREIGTRLAIGASRARIVRQLLTESLLLGLLGGALGLGIAAQIMPSFAALVQVPPAFDVSPDFSVYAFVGLLTIAVGLIAGLAPARYGRRGDLMSVLKTDQQSAPLPLPRHHVRSLLIGGQAAVSVVLLVLAALLTRSLMESVGFDLGYDASRLMTVSIGQSTNGRVWSEARKDAYWSATLERIRQLPGVASASLTSVAPFSGATNGPLLNGRQVTRNEASPEYFGTLGIRLVRGRIYTAEEMKAQAPVAVISARLARQFWGQDEPIGSTLERVWGSDDAAGPSLQGIMRKPRGTRVIGVVADVITILRQHDAPTIYLPLSEASAPRLVVRSHGDPHALVHPVRDALEAIDPSVRPSVTFPLDGLERELKGPRILASLAVIVGATALGLAVIGLFGVTAFVVAQRTHEVSVRRALGASGAQIMNLLLRDSLTPVAIGLGCGLLLSLLGGRVVQSVLYGVNSRDPIAILAAVLILLSAAGAAVFLPARRAARVNPAHLLKLG
jgi:predicted permease